MSPRVDFPVAPVDLRPEATRLVGGSSARINGAPVACLHYDWNGHRISLFQVDAGRLDLPALEQEASRTENYVAQRHAGLSCVAWRSRRVNCVLVAREMPMHQLFQLACHACERQSSAARM